MRIDDLLPDDPNEAFDLPIWVVVDSPESKCTTFVYTHGDRDTLLVYMDEDAALQTIERRPLTGWLPRRLDDLEVVRGLFDFLKSSGVTHVGIDLTANPNQLGRFMGIDRFFARLRQRAGD